MSVPLHSQDVQVTCLTLPLTIIISPPVIWSQIENMATCHMYFSPHAIVRLLVCFTPVISPRETLDLLHSSPRASHFPYEAPSLFHFPSRQSFPLVRLQLCLTLPLMPVTSPREAQGLPHSSLTPVISPRGGALNDN